MHKVRLIAVPGPVIAVCGIRGRSGRRRMLVAHSEANTCAAAAITVYGTALVGTEGCRLKRTIASFRGPKKRESARPIEVLGDGGVRVQKPCIRIALRYKKVDRGRDKMHFIGLCGAEEGCGASDVLAAFIGG